MEIQIIVMSILSYLILFNCSLTFRLNLKNNIVITTMLVFNIVLIREYIGSLFVIPMFTVIILYVCYLKRQDWLWNVFLIIFSYTLLVVVDNLTHFVWSIIGMDLSIHWPIYMLIDYPVFYVVCRLTSKKVVEIKRKYFLPLSPKILIILGADLILCMLIFVMNIMVTEQAGSPPRVLFTSIILYIAYVVLTFLIVATIVYEYETNANIMMKQNSYVTSQEMGGFSISFMRMDDELKKYYDMEIFPISNLFNKEKDVVAKLHNLDIIELKSLISVKINYALELKVEVNLEIIEKIDKVNMKSIDLVRIIGIFLDNAIEACQECEKPSIDLSIIKMDKDITFIVKNTYIKKNIDYCKLGTLGISSKGERRGTGLYNVKTIINAYNNVIMDTEYENGYFTQLLEIYG